MGSSAHKGQHFDRALLLVIRFNLPLNVVDEIFYLRRAQISSGDALFVA
jgi:hypothetical protein